LKKYMMTSLRLVVLAALICYASAALTIDPALCKVDLVFCIDNSGSIAYTDGVKDTGSPPINWKRITDFCKNIAGQLVIGPANSQVGAVDFSVSARIQFGLNKYATSAAVNTAISAIPYVGGMTNTSGGLFKSRDVLTNAVYGSRAGKSKIVVLITDDFPNVANATVFEEAQNARNAGVRVILVTIGDTIDDTVMRKLAYSSSDYIHTNDFSDLDSIKNVVLNDASCKPLPVLATTTTAKPPVTQPAPIVC